MCLISAGYHIVLQLTVQGVSDAIFCKEKNVVDKRDRHRLISLL